MNSLDHAPFSFKCQQTGHCCTDSNIIVTLTFKDVFNLFNEVKKDFDALLNVISFYKIKQSSSRVMQSRMVLSAINTSDGEVIPGLRKVEEAHCIFYDPPNCKIYNSRPLACRNYPFTFNFKKSVVTWNWAKDAEKTCRGIGKGKEWINSKLKEIGLDTLNQINKHNEMVKELVLEATKGNPLSAKEALWIFIAYGQKE
ncbi:MAG: YkgJ family cysteine cluster protein [Candidatus Hodarchaeales archaeon]